MLYTTCPSPLGELLITGPRPGVLHSVSAPGQKYAPIPGPDWQRDKEAFATIVQQLDGYFAGRLTEFEVTYEPAEDGFRDRVWAAIDRVPYGTTVTYGELASMAGATPRAARAVGGAVGRNPAAVVRPCHRIVGANGALTGYAGGVERKRQLLQLEGALRA